MVVRPGSSLTPERLVRHCRDRLASFETPKQVVLQTEPLPRTPTGRVRKYVLVERHADTAAASA